MQLRADLAARVTRVRTVQGVGMGEQSAREIPLGKVVADGDADSPLPELLAGRPVDPCATRLRVSAAILAEQSRHLQVLW